MRRIILLFLFLAVALIGNSQAGWMDYEYGSHQFKIAFFQQPDFSVDTTDFNNSPLITNLWEVNVEDPLHENIYYSVSKIGYPSDYIHSDSLFSTVEGFISSTQSSLTGDENFTLLASSLTEKHGYPGKVFKWKRNSNGALLEFHVYLIENQLFELAVVSRAGKNHNTYLEKFFNSFEIINIPKGNYSLPVNGNKRTLLVNFPEVPNEQSKTVDSEYGKLSLDIQILEPAFADDNMVYIAMETKYPPGAVDQRDAEDLDSFYKKAIDGSLNSVNGELVSISEVYYQDYPGKEYRCYLSGGQALMVYRYYFIKDNFYSLGVITLPEKDRNKGMISFFDSFEIID